MTHTPVSVVVVSHGRPALLTRCLTGLAQLAYPNFEVIVVADPAGAAAVRATGLPVKLSEFDELNISAARNRGLTLSSGELVAFIDDDSVPEPSWLDHLAAPFDDPRVVAAGGYVRGRNGISFQWRANTVDALGTPAPLELDGDAPQLFSATPGHGIKTEGTNSAFRREILARIGGFDPGFRFYLDETDVNLRLSGHVTAIVPLAQVHHGYAASVRRGADRMPKSLHEVGASSALFLRKHAPDRDPWGGLAELEARQRRRLLGYMVAGSCEPRDVNRLLRTLRAGWVEGLAHPITALPPLVGSTPPFLTFRPGPAPEPVYVSGRFHQRRRLRVKARTLARAGKSVTVFRFSPTTLFHHLRFHPDGFWEQRGGMFGRAGRGEKTFQIIGFHARVAKEWRRVAGLRHSIKMLAPRDDVTRAPE
ncbi:glycosyltransferase family 2 protein [Aliiroseovarius sp.]|uniref:glycosyltransferase family 2 protein n=1 Tax=Aliiroseovarius sp. TaxID=1872442 RepID=UPI002618B903|nr:glycosyltransferase family 2 protein [Aliiroseovarius sp.]